MTANACRMRSSACDTLMRLWVRHALCWLAFPLVSALRSTGSAAVGSAADCSAADRSTLFVGFTATMAERDFSCPCIIGYGSSPSPCGPSLSLHTYRPSPDIPPSHPLLFPLLWPYPPSPPRTRFRPRLPHPSFPGGPLRLSLARICPG